MPGGARTLDSLDGTEEDIVLANEEFQRLVITHRPNEIMSVALINLLELLLQSARTCLCIINLSTLDKESCNISDLKKSIKFHSFRQNKFFQQYCEDLIAKKPKLFTWLTQHCCVLQPVQGDALAICLVRVEPPDVLQYEAIQSPELADSYRRLAVFFKPIRLETTLLQAFCNAFHQRMNLTTQLELDTSLHCAVPSKVTDNIWMHEATLSALYECVDEIYKEFHQIPLVKVAMPNAEIDNASVHYSNLFFFVRLSASLHADINAVGTQDGFMVKLVMPETQQQHLSQFFHEQREEKCPWFVSPSECRVRHIKQCVIAPKWQTISSSVKDQKQIHEHYKPLWRELARLIVSKPRLVGATFRTNTIVFERRSLASLEKDDTQMLARTTSDQLMSCVKNRLIAAPQYQDILSNVNASEEDYVPQLMLIPIYHYDTPIVAIGTVANALRHTSLKIPNEWQRTFQFANFVYRSLAYRFKARMQETYLELLSNAIKEIYRKLPDSVAPYGGRIGRQTYFINQTNEELSSLAKIYAYPKFSLHLLEDDVINKDIHNCLVLDGIDDLFIAVEPLGYWQKPIEKQWFTKDRVFKYFQKAIHEVIAEKYLNQAKRVKDHMMRGQDSH